MLNHITAVIFLMEYGGKQQNIVSLIDTEGVFFNENLNRETLLYQCILYLCIPSSDVKNVCRKMHFTTIPCKLIQKQFRQEI